MNKKISGFVIVGLAASLLFANGTTESAPASGTKSQGNKPVELVYTMTAVPTDAHAQAMQVFKKTVEKVSNGNIKVITYDSGSLFKQDQEVAAVKSGQADITATSASWLTDGSPWVSMFTAGYMFKSYDHMRAFFDSDAAQKMFGRIAKEQGIRPLGAEYLGTRELDMVDDIDVKTPADLKGINLRMPNSESWIFLGKALGANPTPISFSELYMALQTKTVDGQDNPLPTTKNAKFYEVTKSITLTDHLIDTVWPTINEAKWESLTDQQKAWIMEGVKAGIEYCDKTNLDAEAKLVQFFKDQGLKVYQADKDAFSSHVLDLYLQSKYAASWDKDLYNQVQSLAK
ncbi:MAG: sialic acid TRAP transporter substrate-binding protein SiaP [Spirochaetia bacterium]|jgi:tripartite ATP-independent transporter DctP family solute receptor|nr:sialic acid TRAP transporter substrate-binding protein SiaP [Spirochaetia bacterium]